MELIKFIGTIFLGFLALLTLIFGIGMSIVIHKNMKNASVSHATNMASIFVNLLVYNAAICIGYACYGIYFNL